MNWPRKGPKGTSIIWRRSTFLDKSPVKVSTQRTETAYMLTEYLDYADFLTS